MNWRKLGMFAGGVLFGTVGASILKSKDAKKLYTQCTAAVLRGKDSVCGSYEILKENCGDIYNDAIDINDERYAKEEEMMVEEARAIVKEYEESKKADSEEE